MLLTSSSIQFPGDVAPALEDLSESHIAKDMSLALQLRWQLRHITTNHDSKGWMNLKALKVTRLATHFHENISNGLENKLPEG